MKQHATQRPDVPQKVAWAGSCLLSALMCLTRWMDGTREPRRERVNNSNRRPNNGRLYHFKKGKHAYQIQ